MRAGIVRPPLAADVISLTTDQLPHLLASGQHLEISLDSRIVAFVSRDAPIRFCQLAPTTFRMLVMLLLGNGSVVSYASLLAGLTCSEAQLRALLEARSFEVAGFPLLTSERAAWLQQQAQQGKREQCLKRVRGILPQAMTRTLEARHLPWQVLTQHGQGYRLYVPDALLRVGALRITRHPWRQARKSLRSGYGPARGGVQRDGRS